MDDTALNPSNDPQPYPGAIEVQPQGAQAPDTSTTIVSTLYAAIRAAMLELGTLDPSFNSAVNKAFNHLHGAYWCESPPTFDEPELRPEDCTTVKPVNRIGLA